MIPYGCGFLHKSTDPTPKGRSLHSALQATMSALFNFQSMLMVLLLMICTCAYIRQIMPKFIDMNKTGVLGTFYKMARIGERLSPYVSVCCMLMAVTLIFF